jgi:hypothetical protein
MDNHYNTLVEALFLVKSKFLLLMAGTDFLLTIPLLENTFIALENDELLLPVSSKVIGC